MYEDTSTGRASSAAPSSSSTFSHLDGDVEAVDEVARNSGICLSSVMSESCVRPVSLLQDEADWRFRTTKSKNPQQEKWRTPDSASCSLSETVFRL